MAGSEIDLLALKRGTITAPAGCGKTQLIADALGKHGEAKPVLVLTHTNAGVAALKARLDRAGIARSRYKISTLDGWAMRLISTFPKRSGHDPSILELANPKSDYPKIRDAAAGLLTSEHVDDIIASSYSRLIVDEHQDCSEIQHTIVYNIADVLPTCVLGDPMQAIFNFGAPVADWDSLVCVDFPSAGELTTPWRWKNAGEEAFGRWLLDVRALLRANQIVDLARAPRNVTWYELDGSDDHGKRLKACLTKPPNRDGSVLIIADSTKPVVQKQFASQTPGAVAVENVDLTDLVAFARDLDLSSTMLLAQVVEFAAKVMTGVGAADLMTRVDSLQRRTAKREASDVERAALHLANNPGFNAIANLLETINREGGVRSHRPAILQGCYKVLRLCGAPNGPTPHEAAIRVREQSRLIGRPLHKRTVGSTLLLKGLEADVSVVLNAAEMDARHLYVAMTRGARSLVLCSPREQLQPRS